MSRDTVSSVHTVLFDEENGFCGVSPKMDAYAEAEDLLLVAMLGFILIHLAHWISHGTRAFDIRTKGVRNEMEKFFAVNLPGKSPRKSDLQEDLGSKLDQAHEEEPTQDQVEDDKKKHDDVVNEAKIMLKAHDSGEARTRGQFQEVYMVLLLVMFYQYTFVEGHIINGESRRCRMLYYASVVL